MSAVTSTHLRVLRAAVLTATPTDRPARAGELLDAIRKTPFRVLAWSQIRDWRRYSEHEQRVLRDATAAEWLARRAWAREHR